MIESASGILGVILLTFTVWLWLYIAYHLPDDPQGGQL